MITTTFEEISPGIVQIDEFGVFNGLAGYPNGLGSTGIEHGSLIDISTLNESYVNAPIGLTLPTITVTDFTRNEIWCYIPNLNRWWLRTNDEAIKDSMRPEYAGTVAFPIGVDGKGWYTWYKSKRVQLPTPRWTSGWMYFTGKQLYPTPATPVVVTPTEPVIVTPPVVVEPPVIVTPPVVIPAVEVSLGKVYNKINIEDILPKQTLKTTYGIWLDSNLQQTGNLLTYHTCSNQTFTSSNKTIFQSKCDTCPATPMFDISYGHVDGSGSRDLGGLDYFTLTKAVYGQYRNMCFGNVDKIKIGNKTVNHFYVINVKTDRMGDRLDEGLNEINLHHLSGSQFGIVNAHTGSNVKLGTPGNILRLIDDSRLNTNTVTDTYFYNSVDRKTYGGEYYYMVSGSLEQGIYNSTQPAVYGLSFPRLGVILLDADMLDMSASFLTTTGSDMYGDNSVKLFTSLSGSALYTDLSGDYLGFKARKVKYEHVEKYFIRIKNQDFNFSNNPTWVSGSDNIIIDGFNAGNPQTYISQIGMYNDNHELIAVGKINKPIKKSFTSEGLFSVTVKY